MAPPSKRRKTSSAMEEIVFDSAAREEYLTGFHKRKQARIREAQETAQKREKEEKRRERQQLREQRKQELQEQLETISKLIRSAESQSSDEGDEDSGAENPGEEWSGIADPVDINHEDEYVDEDKYTTVTVESVNITRDGFENGWGEECSGDDGSAGEEDHTPRARKASGEQKTAKADGKPGKENAKKKRKKFRYETKEERKVTRFKERARSKARARARRGARR